MAKQLLPIHSLLLMVITAATLTNVAHAALPFKPGYDAVISGPSLMDFEPKSLNAACVQLEKGDISHAQKAFIQRTKEDPTDLAGWIGLMQSSEPEWNSMFEQYKTNDAAYPSPVNDFKVGLLADYILGARIQGIIPDSLAPDTRVSLQKLALQKLRASFAATRSPVVAFALCESWPVVGPGYIKPYQSLLPDYAGENAYNEYDAASHSSWSSPVPNVETSTLSKLVVLRWMVHRIWASQANRPMLQAPNPDPKSKAIYFVPDDYNQDQKAAMAWLGQWETKIKAQIVSQGGTLD